MPPPEDRSSAPRSIAWADGRVVPVGQASMPLTEALRADGVTVELPVRDGRTCARDAFLAQLRASARAVGLRVPVLTRTIQDLLAAWGEHAGVLEIAVTRGGLVRGVLRAPSPPRTLALTTIDAPAWQRPLSGVRTLTDPLRDWATRTAREQEADDALVLHDGRVCELPGAAVVVVADGLAAAPDPDAAPVRPEALLDVLAEVTDLERRDVRADEVADADEVWSVAPAAPLLSVHAVDDTLLDAPGELATEVAPLLESRLVEHAD